MDEYVVSVHRHGSESSYFFRVVGEDAVRDLMTRAEENPDAEVVSVRPLNDPSLFGTGLELGGELL